MEKRLLWFGILLILEVASGNTIKVENDVTNDLELDIQIKSESDDLQLATELSDNTDPVLEGEFDPETMIVDGGEEEELPEETVEEEEDEELLARGEEFMGDMVVDKEMKAWLTGKDGGGSGNRTKRAGHQIITPESMIWNNGEIPYKIELMHFKNKVEREQVREAMDHWEEVSCVRFVDKTYMHSSYVYFVHTDRGCFSNLGKANARGIQRLSLQEPGCRYFGTYLHEMGHAIGLVHEHQLPTRSNFVNYYMTNVDPLKKSQLDLMQANIIKTYNTPYDLGSIMHYDLISFSFDDVSPTLGTDNKWLHQHIGRKYSNMVSFGDARTVNHLYECAKDCDQAKFRACPPPGYLDKDCECMTPQTFDLKYCKDGEGMEAFCAGLVPTGGCDIKNIEHHKQCRRSCDFCPRFVPGETAIGTAQAQLEKACVDRYRFPAKCGQWKVFCGTSRWMHRNCRRTCGTCTSQWGDCPNYDPDNICDLYAGKGHCQLEGRLGDFLKSRCQDSCGTCGYRKEDRSCRNSPKVGDEKCKTFAANDQCEKNPEKMFVMCPSTCNRCYYKKGECNDKESEFTCTGWGLMNWCKGGDPQEMLQARKMCGKTCDSC